MLKVNHSILKWARESAGLSLHDAALLLKTLETKTKTAEERLHSFEAGVDLPTKKQVEIIANSYKRNPIVFYLPSPPRPADYGADFRSITNKNLNQIEQSYADSLKRDVFKRQELVKDLLDDIDELEPLEFVGSAKASMSYMEVAEKIKNSIKLDLNFFRSRKDTSQSFKYIRTLIENSGVYVLLAGDLGSYHTDIATNVFRGFSISDPMAPFIVINDNDAKAAYSFTVLHELAHIWLGQTGISNDSLDQSDIERYCDSVASEILLPENDLKQFQVKGDLLSDISEYADQWKVSSSLVAFRLFHAQIIDREQLGFITNHFKRLYLESKKNKLKASGTPSPHRITKYKVGDALFNLVKRSVYSGAATPVRAASILGVKPTTLFKTLEKA